MFQLERLIHQHDDQPETSGYHQDALWLEEVRHHVCRLERELGKARTTIAAIDERYIDGCDTYDDWKFMGDTARAFLSKNAEVRDGGGEA